MLTTYGVASEQHYRMKRWSRTTARRAQRRAYCPLCVPVESARIIPCTRPIEIVFDSTIRFYDPAFKTDITEFDSDSVCDFSFGAEMGESNESILDACTRVLLADPTFSLLDPTTYHVRPPTQASLPQNRSCFFWGGGAIGKQPQRGAREVLPPKPGARKRHRPRRPSYEAYGPGKKCSGELSGSQSRTAHLRYSDNEDLSSPVSPPPFLSRPLSPLLGLSNLIPYLFLLCLVIS